MQELVFTDARSTTGFIGIGIAPIAASGALRVSNATVALAARNQADGADIEIAKTDNTNKLTLGDATNAATLDIKSVGDVKIIRGASTKLTVGAALVTMADGVIEMGASGPQILKGTGPSNRFLSFQQRHRRDRHDHQDVGSNARLMLRFPLRSHP